MIGVKLSGLLALCVCVSAFPYNDYRLRPQKTVMFGSGFYGHPLTRRSYIPQGTMTMFASGGDAVASNSFIGGQYPALPEQDGSTIAEQIPAETAQEETAEDITQQPAVIEEEPALEPEAEEEPAVPTTTAKPKKTLKRKQKPKTRVIVDDDDESEEDENSWPFQLGGRGVPSYNAFFPITFSGRRSAGRQTLDDEGSYPSGSATAIANSFSTGKGGVASSHATAFGDPALSALFLRRNLQKKNKNIKNRQE